MTAHFVIWEEDATAVRSRVYLSKYPASTEKLKFEIILSYEKRREEDE